MDNMSSNLNSIFMEPAKTTGWINYSVHPQKNIKLKTNKLWLNDACKKSKNNYIRFKNSLPTQPENADKLALIQRSKQHRRLIHKEKHKFDKNL